MERRELDRGHYLLGNRTAALMDKIKMVNQTNEIERINAVITRSMKRKETSVQSSNVSDNVIDSQNDDLKIYLPDIEESSFSDLIKTTVPEFISEQHSCISLKDTWEKIEKSDKFHILNNGLLVMKKRDKSGLERKLIVIPEKYRTQLMLLSHEGMSCHVGTTKTKDKICKYFYWPNCYKQIEEFVKSCDRCQRVGYSNDARKAPLKLVPIIGEPFFKVSIDTVGPLVTSSKGNNYLLTAICTATKYPEAVAISDTTSDTIVNGLLDIFSRIGFPREIQSDQGTYFVSNLTENFFRQFGIKHTCSSRYHAQSNPVERFHRSLRRIVSTANTKWKGPGKIIKRISDYNYLVEMPDNVNKPIVYHVNMLKKYHNRTENLQSVSDTVEIDMPSYCSDGVQTLTEIFHSSELDKY